MTKPRSASADEMVSVSAPAIRAALLASIKAAVNSPDTLRTSISLPRTILNSGQLRASMWRMSFSSYIGRLIEQDLRDNTKMEIQPIESVKVPRAATTKPKPKNKSKPPR